MFRQMWCIAESVLWNTSNFRNSSWNTNIIEGNSIGRSMKKGFSCVLTRDHYFITYISSYFARTISTYTNSSMSKEIGEWQACFLWETNDIYDSWLLSTTESFIADVSALSFASHRDGVRASFSSISSNSRRVSPFLRQNGQTTWTNVSFSSHFCIVRWLERLWDSDFNP